MSDFRRLLFRGDGGRAGNRSVRFPARRCPWRNRGPDCPSRLPVDRRAG